MEEALIKRILPHSIEAEQSVIGSMILDRDAILVASEILTSDDFYQSQYGIIFDAMVELCNEGKPVDDPRIIIEDGVCKLADHSSLVGSIATMDVLVRTMVQKAGVPLADAIRMASETPARLMGVDDRKGSLQRGKDADIVILDRKLNVRSVWSMGHLVEGTNTLA